MRPAVIITWSGWLGWNPGPAASVSPPTPAGRTRRGVRRPGRETELGENCGLESEWKVEMVERWGWLGWPSWEV